MSFASRNSSEPKAERVVEVNCRKIVERAERGNSPEVEAIIESRRPFVEAKKLEILKKARERKEAKENGPNSNGSAP